MQLDLRAPSFDGVPYHGVMSFWSELDEELDDPIDAYYWVIRHIKQITRPSLTSLAHAVNTRRRL